MSVRLVLAFEKSGCSGFTRHCSHLSGREGSSVHHRDCSGSTWEFQHCDGKALKMGGMQRLVALVLTINKNVQGTSFTSGICRRPVYREESLVLYGCLVPQAPCKGGLQEFVLFGAGHGDKKQQPKSATCQPEMGPGARVCGAGILTMLK